MIRGIDRIVVMGHSQILHDGKSHFCTWLCHEAIDCGVVLETNDLRGTFMGSDISVNPFFWTNQRLLRPTSALSRRIRLHRNICMAPNEATLHVGESIWRR